MPRDRSTKRRGSSCGAFWVAGLLILVGLAPRTASAEQWHELYQSGVAALRDGQARRAVDLLRRAIEKRPQPGVRVPTYGTNFEPQYYPYLRLAEAHLLLGSAEEAAAALETSARLGVEPAEERAALETRVRAALDAKRPKEEPTPVPTPTATPPPTPTPPPVTATRSDATEPEATDALAPGSGAGGGPPRPAEPTTPAPEPVAAPGRSTPPVAAAPSAERRRASPSAVTPVPPDRPARPWLDVTSDPPGARVFLDDEPVGRTDPETGRLRLRDLASGRHRLRLSSEDRDDLIREVEIGDDSLAVEAVLPRREPISPPTTAPAPTRPTPVGLAVFGVVALAIVLAGLWVWKGGRGGSVARRDAPPTGEPRRDSGSGEIFPAPFGDYTLLRRIGKGGMAVVYEATRGGETFALKRPLTGFLDDDRFRERFLREAELGRTLHHPNIIRIFDRGQVEGVPFFAMELVRGETLRERLDRDGRLDATLAARVTAQVAEALDYAHNKGVIHRDLKPSNIMLDHSGGVKVMDYGVARAQRLEGLTTTGSFLGTPSYAAPETVDSGSGPQSDVYSLGVVFFEMVTGSLPFRGESAFAVLRSHASTPPPSPASLNYALPETIDRLVLRLLSKEPSERPTAEDLLNELAAFLGAAR